ncbi:hypothetical protein E4P42_11535 [Mycobacterium sp. PS03-16]|uniref:hypothetical protein n=1 Tax=Mycobacterium sp. PS03-16 TaxID=2559611 RepID=UPI0010730D50|nr:hypothetical protein [Mycobacterium sp. PS03-16]TFV58710.1 hypothetical protein E4P42_11535 [Mycobacterium sp. PS03-16]
MTRPYTPYSPSSSERTEPLDRLSADAAGYGSRRSRRHQHRDDRGYHAYGGHDGHDTTGDRLGDGDDHPYDEDYDAYVEYESYAVALDRRWLWVAGVAGATLLIAVLFTVAILGGGDSGSVSATVASPAQSQPPATAAPRQDAAAPLLPPPPSLSPETITTVTPSAPAPAPEPSAAPPVDPAPGAAAPPPPPAADPRTITYQVTGNRPLIDLVTVIYTDRQGALQTEVNVALPWSKTVVLDPGVELKSVTATSVGSQLNCSVTDAAGTTLVAQNNNSMIATCTQ